MVEIINGDLLYSNCNIIAHQANCFSTMGAGIAKQIKKMYPEVYKADKNFPFKPNERLGKYSYALTHDGRLVYNLYGQFGFKERVNTKKEALQQALIGMMENIILQTQGKNIPIKVGLPNKIGCGLGGGDWSEILPIIEAVSKRYNIPIYLYNKE